MLNRHNAELALKHAIQELSPDWKDLSATSADHAPSIQRDEYYMNTLLTILPDYSAATSHHNTTPIVVQLRRRLINILAQEQDLNLAKPLCDTAFNIQLALAKLFPFNKEASPDESSQEEAWEETFTFETITRTTQELIIFPESPVLTKDSAAEYYQGRYGKDENGQPRNLDNTLMSDRQILSLQQQGIVIHKPSADARDLEEDLEDYDDDFEFDDSEDESLSKFIGETAGTVLSYGTALTIMTLSRGPLLLSASFVVAAVTTCTSGPQGFHRGFLATFLWGSAAQTLLTLAAFTCYASGALTENDAEMELQALSASLLPLVLPAIAFAAATIKSHAENKNLSASFAELTTNFFFKAPIKFFGKLGEFIGNSIAAILDFLFANRSPAAAEIQLNLPDNALPPSPSSHAIIMQTISVNPAQFIENEIPENIVPPALVEPISINEQSFSYPRRLG